MEFAGNDYAYISSKKIDKVKKKTSPYTGNNEMLKTVKEENAIEEEEKEIENNNESSQIKTVSEKRISRSIERSLEKQRSRSNSFEENEDVELDQVYSDEEEIETEIHTQKMMKEQKKEGLLNKIGNALKGVFSKPEKKKKVLYDLSPLMDSSGANNLKNNAKPKTYQHEVDTNILSIKFEFLKDKVAFATGDPISCKCEAILNIHSKLEKIEDSLKYLWICEFCGEKNEIFIEKEEIPTSDCIDYYVQSANQLKGIKGYNYNDEQTLIFCFDVSGSMCVSSPVTGKHKFKGNNLEKNMKDLMAFSDGSDQFYGGSRDVTYISRLQCLQAAIESNLNTLLKSSPNRKVGFVTFNNEVTGYGDGSKGQVKINGNNLNDFDAIKLIAEKNQDIISTPLKDANTNLLKQLYNIEESGQTALGPAILFSINLFNGVTSGSRIILCTDGIANMGIGSMEGKGSETEVEELKNYYANLGMVAKEKGIVIDLITFEGEQSNIEILMAMIDQTGGEIIRVKPTEILEQFSNLLTNEVVATNVKVKVKLHKLMNFRNEEAADTTNEGSTLAKEIGNTTKESELYIEYAFKKSEEIAKYEDIEIDKIAQVPFQSIIDYTNKNGDRCIRVVTKNQKLCSEKQVIRENAKYDIISTNAMQKTSKLAQQGQYREAQSNALAWKKMIKNEAVNNSNAYSNYMVFNNNMNEFNNNIQEEQFNDLNSLKEESRGIGYASKKIRNDKLTEQIHNFKKISNTKTQTNYAKSKKK